MTAVDVRKVNFIPYWPANPYQPLLAAQLQRLGINVETGTLLRALVRGSPFASDGLIHLHWLPMAGPDPLQLVRWWLFSRRVARLVRRGVPIVWTAHNIVPHESRLAALDLWLSRNIAKHASRIICHSVGARDELISRLQIEDDAKIRIIPHGHYIESYPNRLSPKTCRAKLDLPPDATVFLSIGSVRPYKGVSDLVDAFRRLRAPDARLLIAGKPHGDAVDTALRVRIGSDAHIRYSPGLVADEELQLYLNAADAVVFPYRESLTSGALILAMSFGRACIAPRLPGMVDCLGEQGGILYEAARKDGLFEALSTAMQQRPKLSEMGAVNLERARSWDWRSIAVATAECYGEAAEVAASASRMSVR